jgi:hypothetical protein
MPNMWRKKLPRNIWTDDQKKSRPSDINRKVPDYNVEPLRSGDAATIPEYTFCDEANADRYTMDSNYAFVEVSPNTFISKLKADA